MPIRKSSILASATGINALYNHSRTSYIVPPRPHAARGYADVPNNGHFGAEYPWPQCAHPHKPPTPYQIFDLCKGAPYRKDRFVELVKIYHPDRNLPSHIKPDIACPHAVRLERYRLIVAAHGILSDPAKRSAYDKWGAGWGSAKDINVPSYERRHWKPGQDPMGNATWEDWERWYNRDKKSDQHPVFVSNGTFVACIMLAMALGGYGQLQRAGNFGTTLIEQRDIVHSQASKELKRARQASRIGDRDERVESFLRHRDATTHREEAYRRLLPEPEVCSSEDVKGGSALPGRSA
ncbi:uncharacterized protein K452DRAFT_284714 [Aplosporella prunicola CBS 121167]|uniref:J domain-containing protein n=1 Tax=Aplosporella prunicola CBS 121167 TaxID=1176127 RepID=A0A6A6BPC7_9PEZI|nr:uncharacterized protein K452DRAFT_284714 [Aplosporella prunicola CBS 121167]KAF2144401.1 hypothetical protein K452DRAFT_284714 [Aplosporella prunicola CBS 121167]